jgi:hypothetical protein
MDVGEKEWQAGEMSGGGEGFFGENKKINRLCG